MLITQALLSMVVFWLLLVMTMDSQLRGFLPILDRSDGIILLLLFGVFVYITIVDFLRQREDPFLASVDKHTPQLAKNSLVDWGFVVAGSAALGIGGEGHVRQQAEGQGPEEERAEFPHFGLSFPIGPETPSAPLPGPSRCRSS